MWRQVRLVAALRWRLFVNSLRTSRAKWEFVASVVLGILAGVVAMAIGLGLGVAGYAITVRGRIEFVGFIFWGLFFFGQFFPFLVSLSTAQLDDQHLLRFPLRFPVFYALNLFYGLLDPVAVTSVFWLACAGAGIVYARPDLWPWVTLTLCLFALVNLLLTTYATALLTRLLQKRRAKEVVFVLFVLGMLSMQIGVNWAVNSRHVIAPYWPYFRPVAQALPPGAAGLGIAFAARGDVPGAAWPLALLGGAAALLMLLLGRRLLEVYRGEVLGWSPGAKVTAEERKVGVAWKLPGLSGPVAAIVEKEFRYLTRNAPMFLQLVIPLFVVGILSQSLNRPNRRSGLPSGTVAEWMFPGALAYALLILAPMIHNSLSYEGRGIQALLLAPVKFREVLIGKNVVQGLMLVFEAALIWVMLGVLKKPPEAMITAATVGALAFAGLAHMTVGNLMSLRYPKRFDFGKFKQRQSGMSVLVGMLLQVVVTGLIGLVFLGARLFGAVEYAAGGFLALAAATYQVYLLGLDRCTRLAEEKRETLAAELCKES